MNITGMSGGSFTINGLQIEMRGRSLYVNGRLYGPADGSTPAPEAFDSGDRTLTLDRDGRVVGDVLGSLEVHGQNLTVIIEGNVGGSVTCGGDLTCEKVGGSANAGRDVRTGKVGGSANAGRDVVRG